MMKIYRKVNEKFLPIELITGYTGCIHFKEDLEHKQQNEEADKLIEEMHKRWKEKENGQEIARNY